MTRRAYPDDLWLGLAVGLFLGALVVRLVG